MNAADIKGMFFLDTNVLVYSFDLSSPVKQAIAREWIQEALRSRRGVISSQVVHEFLNVALSKFARPMGVTEAREYLRGVLQPLCQHFPAVGGIDHALLLREQTGCAWYDALVLAAAIETRCAWLITEDFEHGRKVGPLTIHNPFPKD